MQIFNVSNVTVNKRVMFNLKFLKYHNFHKNTKQHDSFQHIKMISEGSWDTKDSWKFKNDILIFHSIAVLTEVFSRMWKTALYVSNRGEHKQSGEGLI